jgi:tetratricopeptide (TPR) repeat protein
MQAKKSLTLIMALALAAPMAMHADDAATTSADTTTASTADAGSTTPAATAAATPVAKNDAPGSIKAGNALNDDGKYDAAAAYFEGIGAQVAENGNTKREPWRLIGWANAEIGLGNFDKAADLAQQAINIAPNNEVAWNHLGAAQAQGGHRDDAIATYNKAITTLKAAGVDTSKLEANLATLKQAAGDDSDSSASSSSPTAATSDAGASAASTSPAAGTAAQ